MELIKCFDALTISKTIKKHLKSNPFLFNNNTLIQCDNNKSTNKLNLSNWNIHIKFNCDYHIVNCPKIKYSVNQDPNVILNYTIHCCFCLFGVLYIKLTVLL